ncbi:MAG: hypothetical protein J7L30_03035, partial [Methanophagales archaeon]|nr:hypothetical protein [Methanophagales archaeon]
CLNGVVVTLFPYPLLYLKDYAVSNNEQTYNPHTHPIIPLPTSGAFLATFGNRAMHLGTSPALVTRRVIFETLTSTKELRK